MGGRVKRWAGGRRGGIGLCARASQDKVCTTSVYRLRIRYIIARLVPEHAADPRRRLRRLHRADPLAPIPRAAAMEQPPRSVHRQPHLPQRDLKRWKWTGRGRVGRVGVRMPSRRISPTARPMPRRPTPCRASGRRAPGAVDGWTGWTGWTGRRTPLPILPQESAFRCIFA